MPLLGRDWLLKLRLDWLALRGHHSVHKVDEMSLKKELCDVFKRELVLLQGAEAIIELNEGTKPRFCKNHPIPFVLREQVEQTIQNQILEGELEPIDQSDWATPIVVVTKKDGDSHLC